MSDHAAVPIESVRSYVTGSSIQESPTVCERLMSIQTVIALMCFFCIVTSTTSSSVITISSCDRALDKTRSSGDRAAGNCFMSADKSLRENSIELLTYSTNAVDSLLVNFFEIFISEQRRMNTLIYDRLNARTANITWDWLIDKKLHFDLSMSALSPNGVGVVGLGFNDDLFFLYYNLLTSDKVLLFNDGSNTTHSYQNYVRKDGTETPLGALGLVGSYINSRRLINNGVIVPGQLVFDEITPFGDYAGALLTNYQKFDDGNEFMIYLSFTLPKISQFLSSIASRTRNSTGANARIYTCVKDSWTSRRYVELGNLTEANRSDQRGILTGVSDGDVFLISPSGTSSLIPDIEAPDLLIQGIATAIYSFSNNYSAIENANAGTVVLNVDNNGTFENHFVQVRSFDLQEYGLSWWLVTSIDVEYVLGDVSRQRNITLAEIHTDKEHVRNDIDNDRNLMIIIVVFVTVFLVVGSFAVTWKVLNKIKKLQIDMKHVAEMDLDFNGQTPSNLLEVARMQQSFEKMKKNLKEFRAYVPSSLLGGVNTTIEPPTGDVALVFTDIQGSTKLWDKSSSGMNIAMELHNEIMRSSLLSHRGYEVKTIGDAFMIAFTNPVNALLFCFEVQLELQSKSWPDELEIDDQGLRVRMGCHYGDVILEENPLSGRSDYRGTTVITASRIEGKALAGTVCITDALLNTIKRDLIKINNPAFLDIGDHELRGLSGKQQLHLCACQQHAHRVASYKPKAQELSVHATSIRKSPSRQNGTPRSGSAGDALDSENNKNEGSCTSGRSGGGGSMYNTNQALPPSVGQARLIPHNKKTGLTLVQAQVTVAVLRLVTTYDNRVFENCNFMVRAASDAASQTDGVVGSVNGGSMTVVWNASKSCKLHATAAMRFASQLERRICDICTIGIATGNMLHGNVGTQKKRFQTVFGRPLDVAEAAADNARRLGAFCILADCTVENKLTTNSAISPFLRIVDIWSDRGTSQIYILYEALTGKLMTQLEDAWGTVTDGKYVFLLLLITNYFY